VPVIFGFSLLTRYGLGNTLLLRSNVFTKAVRSLFSKGTGVLKSELTGTMAFPQAFARLLPALIGPLGVELAIEGAKAEKRQ
jgi:hypothetical protein